MRETLEEIISGRQHFVRLLARAGYLSGNAYILVIAVGAPKCVTGKSPRSRVLPGHDHPSIHPSGQGHADLLPTVKISWKIAREHLSKFLVIAFGVQSGLLFPLRGLEISFFLL